MQIREYPKRDPKRLLLIGCATLFVLFLGWIGCGWIDFQGIPTLLSVPIPEDIHGDNLFFGGYDSLGGYRNFVVYRHYLEIGESYEKELSQQGWTVITNAKTTRTGILLCLKIEKSPFLNAFIEIYGNDEDRQRTVVYIKPLMRGSICQNDS